MAKKEFVWSFVNGELVKETVSLENTSGTFVLSNVQKLYQNLDVRKFF